MKIILMTAHPDDADIMAGGTIARWIDEGHDVHSVIFTHGEKGHEDPAITADVVARVRESEQRAAAAILGVPRVTFLDFVDGELAWAGQQMAEAATRIVRLERPDVGCADVVLTHDPYAGAPGYRVPQLHPDHHAVGAAVVDACYFRTPGPLYYPQHGSVGLRPHRVRELFLIMTEHADHGVDIAVTFERKVRAVRAHESQFGQHPDVEGFLRGLANRAGTAFGLQFAESFKRLTLR
jgi:LmbE family N-acetylglucosaminyl deacetylase